MARRLIDEAMSNEASNVSLLFICFLSSLVSTTRTSVVAVQQPVSDEIGLLALRALRVLTGSLQTVVDVTID